MQEGLNPSRKKTKPLHAMRVFAVTGNGSGVGEIPRENSLAWKPGETLQRRGHTCLASFITSGEETHLGLAYASGNLTQVEMLERMVSPCP